MSVAIDQVPVFEMDSDWQNRFFLIICDNAVSRLGDEWDSGRVVGLTYFMKLAVALLNHKWLTVN